MKPLLPVYERCEVQQIILNFIVHWHRYSIHSDVSYPGTLGPGTAHISDLPVSQDDSFTMTFDCIIIIFLNKIWQVLHMFRLQKESIDKNVWISRVGSDKQPLALTKKVQPPPPHSKHFCHRNSS